MPHNDRDDDLSPPRAQRATVSWITSLAITVVCCAVQFIIFAGYILDLKEDVVAQKARFNILEQRLGVIEAQIETLRTQMQAPISLTPDVAPVPATPTPIGTAAPLSTSVPIEPPAISPAKP